jgi:hypothetical protein
MFGVEQIEPRHNLEAGRKECCHSDSKEARAEGGRGESPARTDRKAEQGAGPIRNTNITLLGRLPPALVAEHSGRRSVF